MLTVHRSNRLEVLADRLADTLRVPAGDAFRPEVVLVPSDKARRWLSLELAGRLGVAANIDFPFPAEYVWRLLGRVVPGIPEKSPFDRDVLTWRLAGILSRDRKSAPLEPLRAFLGEEDERRRFELARRLASLFGDYLVYRPEWLEAWQSGRPAGPAPGETWSAGDRRAEGWQAPLWRGLASGIGEQAREHPADRLSRELAEHPEKKCVLPRRLALFALRDLPPAYLRIFRGLEGWVDLQVFLLDPCREEWAADGGPGAAEGTLLAAWGGHGKALLGGMPAGIRADEEPGEDTLLHRLQSAVLGNRLPTDPRLLGGDTSLAVHSCHGPRREMEVLHDRLLAVLAEARDTSRIGVLVPDIETYGPYIDAVFGSTAPRIPWAVADQRGRLASPLLAGFLMLLDFPAGRFEAGRVLAILENPAVSRAFGLEERALERIRGWVRETGIRWGLDAGTRAGLGLPGSAEHTWRAGLDRLLLGYALPGEGGGLFEGLLPRDVEGDVSLALGKLARAVEALEGLREKLGGRRTPAEWAQRLRGVVRTFLEAGRGEEGEVGALERAVGELEETAALAGHTGRVGIEPLRDMLEAALDRPLPSSHLSGRVTFGSLSSLAGIPFGTLCLVGMNDGVFPSFTRPPDFDLLARHPRPGDRVRRDEDRYLLLEAILSARDRLYISYAGRSERDDSPLPPSVLVTDLLDHLAAGLPADGRETWRKEMVVEHPLQPFSHRYFETGPERDKRLFSYAIDMCQAAEQSRHPQGETAGQGGAAEQSRQPQGGITGKGGACAGTGRGDERETLFARPLPAEAEGVTALELAALVGFFQGPVRWFLQRRLEIRIEEEEAPSEDREPFRLGRFKDGDLRDRLLHAMRQKRSPADLDAIARAGGELPEGEIGRIIGCKQLAIARRFADRLDTLLPKAAPLPVPLDESVAGIRLTGVLDRVTPEGLLGYEASGIWDKDYPAIWIRHLALHLAARPEVPRVTRWLAPDRTLVFRQVDDPQSHLEKLIGWYREGMRRPIHLFPKTSKSAAEAMKDGKDWESAADRTWNGNDFSPGEKSRPYHRLALGDTDPLDGEFETMARELLLPMLDHLTETRHA